MKAVMLLAFGVVATSTARAQETRVGVYGGFINAGLDGDDVGDDLDPKMGFVAGATFAVALNDRATFKPSILLAQKGAKTSGDGYEYTLSANVIEAPMLFSYGFAVGETTTLHLLGGPSISFIVSVKEKLSVDGQADTEDISDEVKDYDICGMFGLGLAFGLSGGGTLLTDLLYSHGLVSLDDTGDDLDIETESVSLMVGYLF
jgi:hypothetical protein